MKYFGTVKLFSRLCAVGAVAVAVVAAPDAAMGQPPTSCAAAPLSCFQSGKGILKLNSAGTKSKLRWLWGKGTDFATAGSASFGNPVTSTTYFLCAYDYVSGTPSLAMEVVIPAGGTCGTAPCWKATGNGWLYKDKAGSADGITKVKLKSGSSYKGKMIIVGKGDLLPLPAPFSGSEFFASSPRVLVQLQNTNFGFGLPNNDCWETEFFGATKNDANQYLSKY